MANEADGTITKIEPGAASEVPPRTIGSVPQGIAGVGGRSMGLGPRPRDLSHGGGSTLRLLGQVHASESLDPSGAYDSASPGWCCICSGTDSMATEPVGGANMVTLVPDLSTSIPVPHRRWQDIHLRAPHREIRYSNGDIVEPIDFRRGIDQSVPPGTIDTPASSSSRGLVGGDACHDRAPQRVTSPKASRSTALKRPERVTFNLVDPDPEFLVQALDNRLSYPGSLIRAPDEEQKSERASRAPAPTPWKDR